MKHSVELLNKQVEDKEKSCKDEKKRRRKQRLVITAAPSRFGTRQI